LSLPNPVKAHYPGEIWETHTGGLEVVVSSRLYNEGPFGTVITAVVAAEPGHFRPFIVPAGEFGAVYVDRIAQMPTAWLIQRRGHLAPAALAEVDRHLETLFLR
jgi:mRNA-degrading endonuclease toxin of MazEF toxin-antitoxin module